MIIIISNNNNNNNNINNNNINNNVDPGVLAVRRVIPAIDPVHISRLASCRPVGLHTPAALQGVTLG